jgi:hypothetical protein
MSLAGISSGDGHQHTLRMIARLGQVIGVLQQSMLQQKQLFF